MPIRGEAATATAEPDEGLTTLVARLVTEAKEYGRAEMAYVQTLAKERASDATRGIALLAAGGMLATSAFTALLVGLVMVLVPLVGTLLATLIVVGITLAVAGLLARLGLERIRNAARKDDAAVTP